jgi:hypothetical protein
VAASISDQFRAELDSRTSDEVMELLLEYWADRFKLPGTGQRKLVVFFEQARVRGHLWEFRGGRSTDDVPAAEA